MAPRKTAPAGSQTAGKSSRTQPDRPPRTRAGQEVRKAVAAGPNGGTAAAGSVLKGAGKNAAMPVRSTPPLSGKAQVHSSSLSYKGKVFDVTTDTVTEPGGVTSTRDVIRHSGSVVILAVDASVNPADPTILIERQYRHAAGQVPPMSFPPDASNRARTSAGRRQARTHRRDRLPRPQMVGAGPLLRQPRLPGSEFFTCRSSSRRRFVPAIAQPEAG